MTRAYVRIIVQHITCCAKVKQNAVDGQLGGDPKSGPDDGDPPSTATSESS